MSEADPTEVSLVSTRDGVRVEKTFEPEDFPVPAIAFAITSERDEPVEVRITDGVPDPVDPQDIGFHPKYGAEFWSVADDQIVFERSFEPGEEYTTVYGLRSETDGVEQYLTEPTIDRVDPPVADAEDTVDLADPNGGDEGSETAPSGSRNGPTGAGGGDESGPAGPEGPSLPDDVGAGDEDEEEDGQGAGAATPTLAEGELAETLAAELRDGEVDEETVETLREALDVEGRRSVEARLDRVQSDVSDLRAYRDAMEEFIDENGDAQQLLERLEERTEELAENVATLRADADERGERLDELEEGLSSLDEEIESLASDVDSLEGTVDDVEGDVDDLRAVEAQLEDVRDDIEALSEMRERLSSVFGAGAGAGGGGGGPDGDDAS